MKRVYFLRPVGQLGPIKIGCSKLPELRLETLTTWSPMRLEMICSVPGTHKDERTLHGMFRKHQVHGEWFGASKELLALIDHCSLHGELPALPEVIPPHKMEIVRTMRGQYESGMTAAAIAGEHGVTTFTAYKFIRAAGAAIRPRGGQRKTEHGVRDAERAEEFKRRYLAGETLKQIGDSHNLTRERVRQILRKTNVESLGRRPEHHQPHELTETELLAVELYKNGTRPKIIKERTGLTFPQIRTAVVRMGVEMRPRGFWTTLPEDAEITARVCGLYQKGFSATQIAQRVPQVKSPETVYRYLKKGGVPVRNPHMGNFRSGRLTHGRSA